MAAIYWLIAFVILVGIEIMTTALTTIWFAGGTVIAFFAAVFGALVPVQLLVFVVVSFILLFLTRPLAIKYINTSTVRTNVDSLIGKEARVTAEISNAKESGTVSVQGQEWTARSAEEDAVYPEGTRVWIREIQGVKLIVSNEKAQL
ncbi:NfeD family protein [Clostridium sp. OF09-36]|uniref:NfeD family protein n=1 Tax=Clostridium sp. OF09-36 TaxID=2292310 RepID=UPI000E536BE3|nr:NfeD family protein [Clostridium sp. OF09-36]RHV89787.1 NfeD family protein [Clostridium sp. OF09-36]HBM47368.1 NfeD family protein [Lachnoclostridium sp.]